MDLIIEEQKISIFFQKNASMVEMACKVEKVYDDRLDIALPQYFMRYIECLQVGSELTAKVFTKFGTIDFRTIVISSPLEETFTIELDYNSINLKSGEDIPSVETIEPLEITTKSGVEKVKTIELSTEYIKFDSDKLFEVNETFDGALILPKDYGTINFKGTIYEIDPVYENEYTAHYITMSEEARQNLLYYMYMYSTNSD